MKPENVEQLLIKMAGQATTLEEAEATAEMMRAVAPREMLDRLRKESRDRAQSVINDLTGLSVATLRDGLPAELAEIELMRAIASTGTSALNLAGIVSILLVERAQQQLSSTSKTPAPEATVSETAKIPHRNPHKIGLIAQSEPKPETQP